MARNVQAVRARTVTVLGHEHRLVSGARMAQGNGSNVRLLTDASWDEESIT